MQMSSLKLYDIFAEKGHFIKICQDIPVLEETSDPRTVTKNDYSVLYKGSSPVCSFI